LHLSSWGPGTNIKLPPTPHTWLPLGLGYSVTDTKKIKREESEGQREDRNRECMKEWKEKVKGRENT
jgi:hypothetical protein